MQTFLPYPSFEKSAKVLDNKRLWKQVLEANQILKALTDPKAGYQNHPATLMWKGYEESLLLYRDFMVKEWIERRVPNKIFVWQYDFKPIIFKIFVKRLMNRLHPSWLGNEEFHSSHRAALLKKDYDHYKQFNWKEKPKIDYVWPVRKGGVV